MEDKKDTVRVTQNDDSKKIIMKDVELTNLQESHNVNNDISYSNDEAVQNEVQNPVGTVGTYEKDDTEKPPFSEQEESSLEPHIDGDINDIHVDLPIQLPCVEPSETYSETQAEGETKSKSNEMELDREVGTIEEELNSERNGETLTQAEGETRSKSNKMELDREVGTIEEDLNSERNGETLNSEVREVGTIEEELNSERNGETLNSEVREVVTIEEESNSERNGETSKSDVLEVGTIEEESHSERNGEILNSEVKLTLEGETKEDKTMSGSNGMEFHQDTKSNDNDSENLVAGSVVLLGNGVKEELSRTATMKEEIHENEIKKELLVDELDEGDATEFNGVNSSFLLGPDATEEEETGTPEEQLAFAKELENFHKERFLDFRPPRFYQEPLNLLKLWRATVRLGGYEQVTSCKLWRQIGESFKPPKTCTTVSWTFRSFYEKALLEYEKHKLRCGELPYTESSFSDHTGVATPLITVGSGRQRRDAASRAMQGWHSRLVGNGEVGDPTIKDKISISSPKREKPLKSIGLLKRKMPSPVEHAVKVVRMTASDPQSEADVIDIGHPADWVKINVQRTKDCFEVYALIPGLLREEVRVQSDAVGRLVISGQPDQMDNPWGVTPFRKVVSLPSRIDPHQTSAVVTLQGQLFVRVPFDPLDI